MGYGNLSFLTYENFCTPVQLLAQTLLKTKQELKPFFREGLVHVIFGVNCYHNGWPTHHYSNGWSGWEASIEKLSSTWVSDDPQMLCTKNLATVLNVKRQF